MKDNRTDEQKKGQDGTCETVVVKGKDGHPMTINAHEYDEEKHGKIIKKQEAAAPATGEEQKAAAQKYDQLKVDDLKKLLEKKGIDFPKDAAKAVLVALCEANL